MPELRTDWLTGRTVIVAENRAQRPNEFAPPPRSSPAARGEEAPVVERTRAAGLALAEVGLGPNERVPACPFCPGSEFSTPPAVYERRDDSGNWQVRVVPNKFPAVASDNGPSIEPPAAEDTGSTASAFGAHEVIIESSRHVDRTSALTVADFRHVLEAFAERLRHWRNDERLRYGLVFKNQGADAGASMAHLHSQLIALPAVPATVAAELRRACEASAKVAGCPYCRMMKDELSAAERIVLDRGGYVAFCPFASLQPHEVWLMPASHSASFESNAAKPNVLGGLAEVLHGLITRLEATIPTATYNMLLRTTPWRTSCDDWYHWRIELLPRVNSFAGLEIATGVHINPLSPEHAAAQLRAG